MISNSVVDKTQGFIYPASPQLQITAFNKPQANQHFALNAHSRENREMLQSFINNSNSFNTTNTYNYITADERSEILAWISPLEPRVRHRDIAARRVDTIGVWMMETEEFRCWHNGSRGDGSYRPTLFCHGNPGVGKSYIT